MQIKLNKVKESYEVIVNTSVRVYYNEDIDKCMAWIKLNFKLDEKELRKIKDGI